MRFFLVVLIVALGGCGSESSPQQTVPIPDVTDDMTEECECLAVAPYFSASCVGIAGAMPHMVPCWRAIVAHADGDDHFRELLDHATLAGQLYGLAGLYFTDRSGFDMYVQPYLASTDSVRTFEGCIIRRVEVRELMGGFLNGTTPAALQSLECPF